MDKKLKDMAKEEQLEELKRVFPEGYRTLSAFIHAREHNQEDVPNAFSYVRALQEFDKNEGIKVDKEFYLYVLNEYEKIEERFRKLL